MSKEINLNNKSVIISRTDSIGDVVLTLPMCAWLKKQYPNVTIIFLGNTYTAPILRCYPFIDKIIEWKEIESLPLPLRVECFKALNAQVIVHAFPQKEIAKIAKKAKIPFRIGTSHRSHHLLTCNIRPNFTRRKSPYHEAQLNFELLRAYGIEELPSIDDLNLFYKGFKPAANISPNILEMLQASGDRKKVILHAKSQGSAVEWGLDNFAKLARNLSEEGIAVYYTGTEKEGVQIRGTIPTGEHIYDVTGKMNLDELIVFINACDTLVACSTGPLHIAAALGKQAIGLYAPKRPIHPGRWMPIGPKAKAIVFDENCEACSKGIECNCIQNITVEQVLDAMNSKIVLEH